ncbi:MAG: FecR family protein [Pseudomonadota bacterium]
MTTRAGTAAIPQAEPPTEMQAGAEAHDALQPFAQALAEHFPSRQQLLAQARAQTARQRRRKQVASRAGTVLAVALLAGTWWLDPAWRTQELRTAVGERSSATLSDGSTVQLNTGTVLQVQSRLRSRQLVLLQGEVLFSVGKGSADAWKPFIVHAPGARVRDIGTTFNVKVRDHETQVTVIEGAVEVSRPDSENGNDTGNAPPQRINAGQAWIASTSGTAAPPSLAAADPTQATAWQRGKLVFDGTPLADALTEVQRYRRAPIRVLDERAARMRVSGEYDLAGIEALIDALPATLPVRVQRTADGGVVVESRR